jgi:flavin reductase (DIM6/NTAB) family NADH-FMN oxidoreductase RutF/rubredoxin
MQYKAFHKLSYGLYIIATRYNGRNAGYIGNTVFQITSSPPQIAISCHKENASAEKIVRSKIFSLSVLEQEADTSLIGKFGFMSSSETDKFQNLQTKTAITGAPIVLDSSVAWFDCKVVSSYDVGTHILIIGEVVDSEIISSGKPLTYDYYREKYKMLAPKNAPTYIEKEKLDLEENPAGENEIAENTKEPENSEQEENKTATYTCSICGFQYDPEEGDPSAGIPPGTPFSELPEDYKCPICNAGKEYFKRDA